MYQELNDLIELSGAGNEEQFINYFNGMTQRQIAEHTQTSLGTIKTRVRQGLKKLERILRTVGYRNAEFLLLLFFTATNSPTL